MIYQAKNKPLSFFRSIKTLTGFMFCLKLFNIL
jgi:hypothetical protein